MATSANGQAGRTVLFLCTGNYYRSRHAEVVFDHQAKAARLSWRAASRGLALEFGVNNVGPMSKATAARLAALGIPHEPYVRFPISLTEADLAAAHLVVALKEAEHRPLLARKFPGWEGRVTYWHVHDLDQSGPAEAIAEIEELVEAVLRGCDPNGNDRAPMTNK